MHDPRRRRRSQLPFAPRVPSAARRPRSVRRPPEAFGGPWGILAVLVASACTPGPSSDGAAPVFEVAEASIGEIQEALDEGRVTSVQLVDAYMDRIAAYDRAGPRLNAIVRLNPAARERAAAMDAERAAGSVRGPLHGVPIVLKDNYDLAGMPTTGSSLALAGLLPPDDAFQVAKLLEAGVVVLAKTNLHELAAGITTVSSLGGQTRNPYDPSRNPGGSSGGTGAAVAASFAAVGWGTDTCGSIRIPAAVHSLFGLRPTKGLSSIDGILPLSHSQDTGGPLARTASDLAIALDATIGRDPADAATAVLEGRDPPRFQQALDPTALDGARIGVLAEWTTEDRANGPVTRVIRDALAGMADLGAEVVDTEIPGLDTLLANTGLIDMEFKFDLADYLAGIPGAPVASLGDILAAGLHHAELDRTFRRRDLRQERDSAEYAEAMVRRRALSDSVLAVMDRERFDALAYPTMRQETALIGAAPLGGTCFLSAHTGLPALTLPAGFTELGLPVGLELLGRPLDDDLLVAMAFAFESASPQRQPPSRTPPLVAGKALPPSPVALDPPGDGIAATMTLDLPTALLSYRIALSDVEPADVYGIVLRRIGTDDDAGDGAMVVRRLGPPGETTVEGAAELSPRLVQDLLDCKLELLAYTASGFDHRKMRVNEPCGP